MTDKLKGKRIMHVKPVKRSPAHHKYNQLTQVAAYNDFEAAPSHKGGDLMINVNSLLGCISYLIQTLFGISGGVSLAIIMIRRSDSWATLSERARDGVIIFGITCCAITLYTCLLWLIVRLWKRLHESEPR